MNGLKVIFILVAVILLASMVTAEQGYRSVPSTLTEESAACLECHETEMPAMQYV